MISSKISRELFNELIVLYNKGLLKDVIKKGENLLRQYPNTTSIYSILGAANLGLGKFKDSITNCTKAIQIKSDDIDAHNNLGAALYNLERFEEAIKSFLEALKINSNHVEANYNLGNTLKKLYRFEEAIASYSKVIQINPDYAEAYNNLGNVLKKLERTQEAISYYNKAILLKPDSKDFCQNLSFSIVNYSFDYYDVQTANNLLKVLNYKTLVRPNSLIKPILSLLRSNPKLQKIYQMLSSKNIDKFFEKICNDLKKITLFHKFIELSPIPDFKVEYLLKELRKYFLLNAKKVFNKEIVLNFQISLALNCFINEYIFEETEEEKLAIRKLEKDIKNCLTNNKKFDFNKIACLASYRPLHKYTWFHNISVPKGLESLFRRQVDEILEEKLIRNNIPCLKNIEDKISIDVQKQYEEYPYPRWIYTQMNLKSVSIYELIKLLKLKLNNINSFSNNPDILVAGCGTGQHSISTASFFSNSKILAIDLSLSSLSYAMRKTKELDINNIEYLQADILDLVSLNKQFDIVECVGVLHHMSDPMAGWQIITDCLKPKGLMKIGLYSKIARRNIIKVRDLIFKKEFFNTQGDVIDFRKEILNSNDPIFNTIKHSTDFFCKSTLKDFLFHVQEYQFTIPGIESSLKTLGLIFAGFEFENKNIINKFKQIYPKSHALYSLDCWHEFELKNPDIFRLMYQFWVQKI